MIDTPDQKVIYPPNCMIAPPDQTPSLSQDATYVATFEYSADGYHKGPTPSTSSASLPPPQLLASPFGLKNLADSYHEGPSAPPPLPPRVCLGVRSESVPVCRIRCAVP